MTFWASSGSIILPRSHSVLIILAGGYDGATSSRIERRFRRWAGRNATHLICAATSTRARAGPKGAGGLGRGPRYYRLREVGYSIPRRFIHFHRVTRPTPRRLAAASRLPPASSLIAESDKRLGKKLGRFWQRHFKIPWWKYRSEKRREQLEGCARVLGAARELFAEPLHPFSEWHGRLIEWLDVAGWAFPTGMSCTDMELTARPSGGVPSAPNSKPAKGGRCHGARSPP